MKKSTALPLKTVAAIAMLSAISIVCGKYLAFGVGDVLRFSLENLPILFAGLALGPIAGIRVGAVGDLVGCLLVGYAINPLITLGAVATGGISGLCELLLKRLGASRGVRIFIAVSLSHLTGSVVIKTLGLSAFYGMPLFALMLWRLFNYLIIGTAEGLILYFLFKNKSLNSMLNSMKSR